LTFGYLNITILVIFILFFQQENSMRSIISSKKQKGQGLVEYALILVLVSIVVVLVLTSLGGGVSDVFRTINETFSAASGGGALPVGAYLAAECEYFPTGTTIYGSVGGTTGSTQIQQDTHQFTCN
jgi:pilus assembly protein Flp/PilA